ncbi:MAG: HlyC/CorC family transporter [Acidobacteria bacterium]|nr:HlyC/CorC family transporter [Acidobacteriota bacterium]
MTPLLYLASVLGMLLLVLSLIETSITHLSRLQLRVLLEKSEKPATLLQRIVGDRSEVLIPLQFSIQLTQISLAVLGTYLFFLYEVDYPLLSAFVMLGLCVFLLRQLIPKLVVGSSPEKVFLFLLPLAGPIHMTLRWIGWPLLASLSVIKKKNALREEEEEEEQPSEEEIQAFLDVGEEEGILEEHDSEMIQSVVEFGDTLVREVMTPRTEMVTISQDAFLQELKTLMVTSKHSRIPVYADTPEQVVGVVSVRQLLAEYSSGTAQNSIRSLLIPIMFTPESKRVRELLKEMQLAGDYMAIVVNEYGEVAGLVTIEDLVEEIVGEIRDEDEQKQEDIVCEGLHKYVLRGKVTVSELEELFDMELEETAFTTISGWLVNHLGRVPQGGEVLEVSGLRIEIINADRKRIHSLRVQKLDSDAGAEEAGVP